MAKGKSYVEHGNPMNHAALPWKSYMIHPTKSIFSLVAQAKL